MASRPAGPSGSAAAAAEPGTPPGAVPSGLAEHAPELPGCRPVRITRAAIDDYEGRFEVWDAATETAWVVREPTSVYHEGPGQQLAGLLRCIAAVRGAPILTLGTADLLLRDARGERQRIVQADQMVWLDPAETRPRGPAVEVGADHLPDVVLEVDYATDVRRGKLGLYEAWGVPEVWVEVPAGTVRTAGTRRRRARRSLGHQRHRGPTLHRRHQTTRLPFSLRTSCQAAPSRVNSKIPSGMERVGSACPCSIRRTRSVVSRLNDCSPHRTQTRAGMRPTRT